MRSTGPAVAVPDATFEQMSLERIKPSYTPYPEAFKRLAAVKHLSDPIAASPTDPAVIDLLFETPGYEPDLGFLYFVKGAACLALIVEPRFHEAVKASIADVGERVLGGGGLPPLDAAFRDDMNAVVREIFANREPASWRSLLAFSTGVFWLLSFVAEPDRRHGTLSSREWAYKLCTYFAALMFTPS